MLSAIYAECHKWAIYAECRGAIYVLVFYVFVESYVVGYYIKGSFTLEILHSVFCVFALYDFNFKRIILPFHTQMRFQVQNSAAKTLAWTYSMHGKEENR